MIVLTYLESLLARLVGVLLIILTPFIATIPWILGIISLIIIGIIWLFTGKEFGFAYYFFVHPIILSDYGKTMIQESKFPNLVEFYKKHPDHGNEAIIPKWIAMQSIFSFANYFRKSYSRLPINFGINIFCHSVSIALKNIGGDINHTVSISIK